MTELDFRIQFVKQILNDHCKFCFTKEAQELLDPDQMAFIPIKNINQVNDKKIIIPIDPTDNFLININFSSYQISGVKITYPNCDINHLLADSWKPFPDQNNVIYYKNEKNTILLAWNFFNLIYELLTFKEEEIIKYRDKFGRFSSDQSILNEKGLLQTPVINDSIYLLLAVALGQKNGEKIADPKDYVLPPILVLSHDCDQLLGNDIYTQSIRMYRLFKDLSRGKFSALKNLIRIIENYFWPRKYYFEEALAMADIERQFGFKSTFYLLTGKYRGRYGARSNSSIAKEFINKRPKDCEIGIHYNYGYAECLNELTQQISELDTPTNTALKSGRAHYLKFDSFKSPEIVFNSGIRFDESIGYSNCNSYRVGYAGVFRPLSENKDKILDMFELPLILMDANTAKKNLPDQESYLKMFSHISIVGGIVTVLFHPGAFNNPEFEELRGKYLSILRFCHKRQFRNLLPRDFLTAIK